VIHGDLKPSNLIVQEESHQVVMVDFGLALRNPKRGTSSIGYTKVFSPPEQLEADKPLLPESDLYSLGMTMLYALSGKLEIVKQRRIPADTPKPMAKFIERLVAQDVVDRPYWGKNREDLVDTFREVRLQCFGTLSSSMEPVRGR
jgi:serine/threonine protein kinase